jgi:hypothetical protein
VGANAEAIFKKAEDAAKKRRAQFSSAGDLLGGLSSVHGSFVLGEIALKGIAYFGIPDNADNLEYYFVKDYLNARNFMSGVQFYQFGKGDGPLCYKRMTDPLAGTFYICLYNDNVRDAIDVHIRISALTVTENWQTKQVRKFSVKSHQEPYLKN